MAPTHTHTIRARARARMRRHLGVVLLLVEADDSRDVELLEELKVVAAPRAFECVRCIDHRMGEREGGRRARRGGWFKKLSRMLNANKL